ncbi:hypothetical protein NDU88_005651 [Pleurodeles waltl]|uniref:Uncharacterized protein n=1 Tax=Pleurodeles waltl TaxID=8319 RepID=A0AAV7VKK7_PLEWA|nr:hypothetical protein NDU88_005651 [Pleurodeles waltl]
MKAIENGRTEEIKQDNEREIEIRRRKCMLLMLQDANDNHEKEPPIPLMCTLAIREIELTLMADSCSPFAITSNQPFIFLFSSGMRILIELDVRVVSYDGNIIKFLDISLVM